MSKLFLALFLLVFGLNVLLSLMIPVWIIGVLALIAGVVLVFDHFRIRVEKK